MSRFVIDIAVKTSTLTFEHPANEALRVCLRLEQLFEKLQLNLNKPTPHASLQALITLLEILDVVDRPDIKSKLAQTMTQSASMLSQLRGFPNVDELRLNSMVEKLDRSIQFLHSSRERIGEHLRGNEFLNQVLRQLANPGGVSILKSPALQLWLNLNPEQRIAHLEHWLQSLDNCRAIANLILMLAREGSSPQSIECENGFYHQSLGAALPPQLIRVTLDSRYNAYPEISMGKHRLMIRFLQVDFKDSGRATQYTKSITFKLSCCKL